VGFIEFHLNTTTHITFKCNRDLEILRISKCSFKLSLILGSVFILTSGLIFTIERLTAYVYWFAQTNTASYPTIPEIPLFDNLFTVIFL
jgi:hypothetical protein